MAKSQLQPEVASLSLVVDRIRIIYLTSGTKGVFAQSPEPGAHDTSV